MIAYDELSPITCLRAAFSYLKELYDSCVPIVALRVLLWSKEGIAIGVWIYAKLRGII